jgi:hypothetical protein
VTERRRAERDLYPYVLSLLSSEWGLGSDALLAEEVSLHGRLVDLAIMTPSGRTVAFEFKIQATKRAFEQAALNRMSFWESYAVLGVRPTQKNLQLAVALGIGVLCVGADSARLVISGATTYPGDAITKRVTDRIKSKSKVE